MKSVFISLVEAAHLEGVGYHVLKMRIIRNSVNYQTELRPNPNGGKPLVYVALSSLSAQAQRLYKAQTQPPASKAKVPNTEPWYLTADFNWYKSNYSNHLSEGMRIADDIEQYHNKKLNMKPGQFEAYMSDKYAKDTRHIRRYIKSWYEAACFAYNKEIDTGENYDYFKILAVSRKPRESNTFPSLTDEVKAFIENTLYNKIFVLNRNPISNLYDDLREKAKAKEWTVPSYDTVLRYVDYIKKVDGAAPSDLLAHGVREWKNKHMNKRPRDTANIKVLEVVQTDGHTFDCFVSVKRANGTLEAVRPILISMLDVKSRTIISHVICEQPNAQIVKECCLGMMYPKKNEALPYGIPQTLMTDNGKEFTAKTLTGAPRKCRISFDEDEDGFYKNIGIEATMRALPYEAWIKAQVERLHGTISTKFTKRQLGYTGTLTGKSTEAKIQKDIKGMLERGELPTIEEFAQQFEDWIVNYYHVTKHRGLVEQGEKTPTPIEVFNTAERYIKAAPPKKYAVSLLMKSIARTVGTTGIGMTIGGKKYYYNHEKLRQGDKVYIRYDPENLTSVLVYDEDENPICEAVSVEMLNMASNYSATGQIGEAAIVEHCKEQKRQLKEARETIKKRSAAYEQRQLNLDDAGKKVIAPEWSKETQSLVSLPQNTRYLKEEKMRKADANSVAQKHTPQKAGYNQEPENDYVDEMYAYLSSPQLKKVVS